MQRTSHPVHQEVEAEEDEVVLEEAFQTEGVALPVAHPSEDLLLGVVLQAGLDTIDSPVCLIRQINYNLYHNTVYSTRLLLLGVKPPSEKTDKKIV